MKAVYKILNKRIQLKSYNDVITLWFFGDIHRDAQNCDVDRWRWFLQKAKASMDEYTYFIGMGDYNDFASTREKKYLKSELHETTQQLFDEVAMRHNKKLASEMSFMKGRLLGLIEGNHSWIFQDSKTSGEDLAERLDSVDMGWLCHFTITLDYIHSANSASIHFVLCHGKAGGKTHGITINQVADLKNIFPVADVYCMGHDHQRAAQPCNVIVPVKTRDGYDLKQKRQYLCRSGSFLKGYQDGSCSYEIFKLYKPSDLGALQLKIKTHRDRNGDKRRIITDISAII